MFVSRFSGVPLGMRSKRWVEVERCEFRVEVLQEREEVGKGAILRRDFHGADSEAAFRPQKLAHSVLVSRHAAGD